MTYGQRTAFSEIKCLRCGQLTVQEKVLQVDRRSEKKVGVARNLGGGGLLLLFGGMLVATVLIWVYKAIIDPSRAGEDAAEPVVLGVLAIPTFILGIELVVRYIKSDRVRLHEYACACGHHWEQWEDGWDAVACPMCGKAMVTTHLFPLDPSHPEKRTRPDRARNLLGGLLALVIGPFLVALASSPSQQQARGSDVFAAHPNCVYGPIGVLVTLGGAILIASYFRWRSWVTLFMHQCCACGHRWERREDEGSAAAAAPGGVSAGFADLHQPQARTPTPAPEARQPQARTPAPGVDSHGPQAGDTGLTGGMGKRQAADDPRRHTEAYRQPVQAAKRGVVFDRKMKRGPASYDLYTADDAEEAKEFLRSQKVTQGLHYVEVKTPNGTWGLDKDGLYLVELLPWQSDTSSADCEGQISQWPSIHAVQLVSQGMMDNAVAMVRCGKCAHEWWDGIHPQRATVVRCPKCGSRNLLAGGRIKITSF